MQTENLNKLQIPIEEREMSYTRPKSVVSGETEVVFDGLENRLIELIDDARMVLGCVAWLTNRRILRALRRVEHVTIVVQKEDFLRPDAWANDRFRDDLRTLYDSLRTKYCRYDFDGLINRLNYNTDTQMDTVRCAGNYNRDKMPAFPRMHHKFVLTGSTRPNAVWTGSFNFTQNATQSFENAVIIRDPQIVDAYFNEFQHIYALSEPLDWTSDWVAPEFRIGT